MTQKTIAERTWRFPNRMTALAAVAKEVFEWLANLPLSSRAKYSVGLAVEEMASNVIKYGYDDDREHEIAVHVAAQDDRVEIVFEDDGHAFDPTGHPKPDLETIVESRKIGGLGIELVRRICEKMTYERVGDRNRLVLHIRRFEANDTQLLSFPQGIPS